MRRIRWYLFLYFTAMVFLETAYRSLDHVARGTASNWQVILIEQGTGVYGTAVLLPLILWSARRFPFKWSVSCFAWHTAMLCSFSLLHTSWNWGTRIVIFALFGMGGYDYGLMPVRYLMEFPTDVITYTLWVGGYTLYRNWLRAKDLEAQLISARLENLNRQLQPHFLFNALNAVSSVMYEDVPRADRMLERIGDFLRATLRLPQSPLVPVSSELALARQYLEVMQLRLEERLHYEIRCDPNAEGTQLPALLLQPLVENAVEHGQDPASGSLDIGIAVEREGPVVQITIRDHGPGPSRGENGHGLSNTQRRLRTVYGDGAALRLAHHPQGGAIVQIRIPA